MTAAGSVAVVIPAWDSARTLSAAIASAFAQTRPPAEVVVVDDGSRDDSARVAERGGARVLRRENGGPGAARNTGVQASACEWIAFLDADDRFEPAKLERQLGALAATGLSACATEAWVERAGALPFRKNAGRRVPARIGYPDLLRGNPIVCSSMVVRRELLREVGLFDEDRDLIATEDYDLWLRVARRTEIGYLDEPLVRYSVGAPSLTSNERFLRGIDKIMRKLGEDRAPARVTARLNRAYDLIATGERARARELLREARALGGGGLAHWKLWLKSVM
jgi:glycosyltransferase involved in cell wall biosynthesis